MEKERALAAARRMADWLVANTACDMEQELTFGTFFYYVGRASGRRFRGSQWNQAFAVMGLLSAAEVFQDERYLRTARAILREMRTLQIFSPFLPGSYGAIRELSAKTPRCYVRDSLSAAWGFLEYYRFSGEKEYLERAELWAQWFFKHGMDPTGWPWWYAELDPDNEGLAPAEMYNDMHGSFHGGSLNFFYQLYLTTGKQEYVGKFFEHIADYFCSVIQQPDGFYRTVEAATGKPPADDPQNGHHRGNDDLGSLGLLCAWNVLKKPEYLETVSRFLNVVFAGQQPDGHFEKSCAAIPVVLNTVLEAPELPGFTAETAACERAEKALLMRQYPADENSGFAGALDELGEDFACSRSTTYALLYLLKRYGGDRRFLTACR